MVKKSQKIVQGMNVRWKPFWAGLRILIGFVFLWAFLDKTFGLGISTKASDAWIRGGSPTAGFLAHATQGPFVVIDHAIASSGLVAWLFMLVMLFVGLAFIFGIGMNLGAVVGTFMLTLMWLSLLWPSSNPFLDYHWFYAGALISTTLVNSGEYFGFGKWWHSLGFVKKCWILQ